MGSGRRLATLTRSLIRSRSNWVTRASTVVIIRPCGVSSSKAMPFMATTETFHPASLAMLVLYSAFLVSMRSTGTAKLPCLLQLSQSCGMSVIPQLLARSAVTMHWHTFGAY